MVSVVLIFVLAKVLRVLKVHDLNISMDIVQSLLHLSMHEFHFFGSFSDIMDRLMSLVGLLDHLDLALVKHISHEKESCNHSKDNNSCNNDESTRRSTFFILNQVVLLFSLDQLLLSILEDIVLYLLLAGLDSS